MTTLEIINKVKFLADEKGIKITHIEKDAGVSLGYVNRLLSQGNKMSIENVDAFAKALGLTFEELVLLDLNALKVAKIKSDISALERELNELNSVE